MHDSKVAEMANVTSEAVRAYRHKRNIPSFSERTRAEGKAGAAAGKKARAGGRSAASDKIDRVQDIVGRLPDQEVAARAGVTRKAVLYYRTKRGIPASRATSTRKPTKATASRKPPVVAASRSSRSKDSLIDPHRDLLGTVPDPEAASRLGVSLSTVVRYRARYGIPAFGGKRSASRRGRVSKLVEHHDLIGTVADRVVAERVGVRVQTVQNYRRKHGIRAWGGRERREERRRAVAAAKLAAAPLEPVAAVSMAPSAPASARSATRVDAPQPKLVVSAEAVSPSGRYGWRVSLVVAGGSEVSRIALGTPAEVVALALQSGLGDLVRLERMEPAI